ncbi:MAG: PAS domain S-box protein [Chlorobiaceae bacterium]|nr:PAS domain S-box protein [Chlorobiaceae bacterium]
MSHATDFITVLIADDSALTRQATSAILTGLGYHPVTASSGDETLSLLQSSSFDALLLDVNMPGKSGIDVLRFLMEKNDMLPVIMISGSGEIDQVVQCVKMGAYDYLTKPVDLNRLAVVLKNALSESALRQKVRLLSAAVDQSPVAVVIADIEGHIEYANPSFSTVSGAFIGGSVAKDNIFNISDDPAGISLNSRKTIVSGQVWQGDFCNRKATGELCWERAIISPVSSQGKAPSHILALIQDITDIRKGKEALRRSIRRFRELADLLPQPVFETDRKGIITYSNRAGFITFGYSRDEMKKGLHALQFFSSGDRSRVLRGIQGRKISGRFSSHEFTILKKDGTGFPALVYAAPISGRNSPSGFRGIVVDITELKETERKLIENKKKYLNLFQAIPDAIIVADAESGVLVKWNRQAQLLFDYSPEELSCLHMGDLYPEELRDEAVVSFRSASGRSPQTLETQIVTGHGLRINVHLSAGMFMTSGNKRFVGIFRDISEQKRSERLIRENVRLKNDFISTVSHELRTPLFSILGFTGTLLREMDELDRATILEFLSIIHDESKRLSSLIEDVLMISRIDSGRVSYKKSEIDPAVTISEVCRSLKIRADEKNIELHLKVSVPAVRVFADPDSLKQVAINIIGNALKFTPVGGRVDVLLSYDTDSMFLSVKDNGPGIPEEYIEKVFEKFYRVECAGDAVDGTGLGLSIAREIVEAHEGTITVQSNLHEGTEFLVRLPLLKMNYLQ